MERGIDGLRLDAIPYLFEKEGTSCENLPETHSFLRQLREHIDIKYKNRDLIRRNEIKDNIEIMETIKGEIPYGPGI